MVDKITDWTPIYVVPAPYTVRVPGHEDRKCGSFEEAADLIISLPRGILIDPHGEVVLTKGKIESDET